MRASKFRLIGMTAALAVILATISATGGSIQAAPSESVAPQGTAGVRLLAVQAADRDLKFQAEILSDGVVEPAEFRRAIEAVASCLRQSGFAATVDGNSPEDLGIAVYSDGNLTARSAEEAMAPLDTAYDACAEQFASLVTDAWLKTHPHGAGAFPGSG